MDRFHVQRVSEDEINAQVLTEIGHPVPAMHAFDADDHLAEVGLEQFGELIRVCWYFFMYTGLTRLIYNADIEASGV